MSNKVETSIKSLRVALFNTLFEVRNNDRSANDALAISKVAHQIIETYKTEIEAVKVANSLKHGNLTFSKNLSILEDKGDINEL